MKVSRAATEWMTAALPAGSGFAQCARHTAVLVLILASLPSLRANCQSSRIIDVENADQLVGREENGMQFRELRGNVRIRQGNVLITCDHAVQNMSRNQADLDGNVIIRQDTLLLKLRSGSYDGDTRIARSSTGVFLDDGHAVLTAAAGSYDANARTARFSPDVTVEDPHTRIAADALFYERDSAKAIAWGNVFVLLKDQHAVVRGDSAIHYVDRKHSIFPVSPRLWQIDTAVVRRDSVTGEADSVRIDTTSIVSHRLEAVRDSTEQFSADGDVEIVRGHLRARCGQARFVRSDSMIILQHVPVLWYEENQLTGDSIAVYLADQSVDHLDVTGNAFSVSRSKPSEKDSLFPPGRFDQAKGRTMELRFRSNRADSIHIEGSSISLYFLYDGRSLNGVRRESGDRTVIGFKDGRVSTIRTFGGVEGTYYPEKFVTGKESTYNLDGFVWRTDMPVQPRYPDLPVSFSAPRRQ